MRLSDAANVTAYRNGSGSAPTLEAASIAIGASRAADALLDITAVMISVMAKKPDISAVGPKSASPEIMRLASSSAVPVLSIAVPSGSTPASSITTFQFTASYASLVFRQPVRIINTTPATALTTIDVNPSAAVNTTPAIISRATGILFSL